MEIAGRHYTKLAALSADDATIGRYYFFVVVVVFVVAVLVTWVVAAWVAGCFAAYFTAVAIVFVISFRTWVAIFAVRLLLHRHTEYNGS